MDQLSELNLLEEAKSIGGIAHLIAGGIAPYWGQFASLTETNQDFLDLFTESDRKFVSFLPIGAHPNGRNFTTT